jgi:ribosome-binding protein aMBF1 (putative translation factor)
MSPEQCRAARNWLGWSQADLAAKARVGLSTVKDYERGERTPIPNNLSAIQRALEAGGMSFTANSVSGPTK